MKVFSRLTNFFSTRPSVLERRENGTDDPEDAPLGSIAAEIEEFHWEALLDDMDRFSESFPQNKD